MRGLDLDDPRTTERRRLIIQGNGFLRRIYEEWYTAIATRIPSGPGAVLELGSGAGFLGDVVSNLITSEVVYSPYVRVILDGQQLPFADGSLRGIAMTDVFHHLPTPRRFLREAGRCVQSGGVICMFEPWVSRWSRFIYSRLHHEPFRPDIAEWGFPAQGPLSGANGAQPWIVFERDRMQFEQEFPEWKIQEIDRRMPFRYLVSGGVSLRPLAPPWSFGFCSKAEDLLKPWMEAWAMFALIVLRRV
jgi:SAM-dependent methyltransferase